MCHSSFVISEHTGQCVTHPLLCQSTQANVSLILCYIRAHRPMCHSSFVMSEHTGQCVTHPLLYQSTQANVSLIFCYVRAHRPMCHSSFAISEHTGQCVTHPQANVSLILCYVRAYRPMCHSFLGQCVTHPLLSLFQTQRNYLDAFSGIVNMNRETIAESGSSSRYKISVICWYSISDSYMIVLPNHIIFPIFVQISQHFRTFYYITSTSIQWIK